MLRCLLFVLGVVFHTTMAAEEVEIRGKIVLPGGMNSPEQAYDVVLLKYILTDEGAISTTGPQGRVKTDRENFFRFHDVPRELQAAFRIGTRVSGKLYQSKLFFLNEKKSHYEIDLVIPGVSEDVQTIQLKQASLILEADIGRVNVTEVWSFLNPTRNIVDSRKNPLSIALPSDYRNFNTMEQTSQGEAVFILKGNELKITRLFPPGSTQLIFQYTLVSWFGHVKLEKRFRNSLKIVRVFTPVNQLNLSSPHLSYKGEQKLHEAIFSSWQGMEVDTGTLQLSISGVPIRTLDFGLVLLLLLLFLSATVFVFFFYRLKQT